MTDGERHWLRPGGCGGALTEPKLDLVRQNVILSIEIGKSRSEQLRRLRRIPKHMSAPARGQQKTPKGIEGNVGALRYAGIGKMNA